MTVDEMLCRWAAEKYDLPEVRKVEFEYTESWRYSDMTPGEPAGLQVTVTYGESGRKKHTVEDYYDGELIREILTFAVDNDGRG